jgi:hypothetical protein
MKLLLALSAVVLTGSGIIIISYLLLNDINDFYIGSSMPKSSSELLPALDRNWILSQASAQLQPPDNQSAVNLTAGAEITGVTGGPSGTGSFPVSNLTVRKEVRPLYGGAEPHDFQITILGIFPGSNEVLRLNSPFPGSSGGWTFSFPAGTQYNVKELELPFEYRDYRTGYSPGCQGVLQPGKTNYCVIFNIDANFPIASSLSNATAMALNSTAELSPVR